MMTKLAFSRPRSLQARPRTSLLRGARMKGLGDSRWAVRDARSSSVPAPSSRPSAARRGTPGDRPAAHRAPSPGSRAGAASAAAELSRYAKIVRRMKWKLPFLDQAYRLATAAVPDGGTEAAASRAEAELMFKLDFFDYYMLCERALVHLLGVFGIAISRDAPPGAHGLGTGQGSGGGQGQRTHRYHANVLGALDRKDNPLHGILGVGDVRWQLARAKDLRNRWKNVDDDGSPNGARGLSGPARPPPLATYDLASILASVHEGLDRAYIFACASVAEASRQAPPRAGQTGRTATDGAADVEEEDEWEFMVDAMDWEAV